MKQLETVVKRVIAGIGSFYSARGIGSQASVGAAVDEERWAGKAHLINCFGIEMVLCDLYLKRFDLNKGLLFDTFVITVWYKLCRCVYETLAPQARFFMKQNAPQATLIKQNAPQARFFN